MSSRCADVPRVFDIVATYSDPSSVLILLHISDSAYNRSVSYIFDFLVRHFIFWYEEKGIGAFYSLASFVISTVSLKEPS